MPCWSIAWSSCSTRQSVDHVLDGPPWQRRSSGRRFRLLRSNVGDLRHARRRRRARWSGRSRMKTTRRRRTVARKSRRQAETSQKGLTARCRAEGAMLLWAVNCCGYSLHLPRGATYGERVTARFIALAQWSPFSRSEQASDQTMDTSRCLRCRLNRHNFGKWRASQLWTLRWRSCAQSLPTRLPALARFLGFSQRTCQTIGDHIKRSRPGRRSPTAQDAASSCATTPGPRYTQPRRRCMPVRLPPARLLGLLPP